MDEAAKEKAQFNLASIEIGDEVPNLLHAQGSLKNCGNPRLMPLKGPLYIHTILCPETKMKIFSEQNFNFGSFMTKKLFN